MIRINLQTPLLNLDDTIHESGLSLGRALSQLLETEPEGNSIKLYSWAKRLARDEVLELDSPDYTTLKNLVENSKRQVVLVKAQILQVIIEAKDIKDSKELKKSTKTAHIEDTEDVKYLGKS